VGFIRRFTSVPGLETILEIEGVVIIDGEPPAQINGVGSGTVIVVGEFENGPFEEPTELLNGNDLLSMFGGFGYEYAGVPSNNPCARARYADDALTPEYWNGNGFIALVSKRFSRLVCVRVDTSVGEVQLNRLARVRSSSSAFSHRLSSGEVLSFDIGAGAVDTTFNGAVAQLDSGAGTYPTTFTGGEKMNVTIDEGTPQQVGPVDIVFFAGDQSQSQAIARINAALGYTAATDQGAGVTRMVGRVQGTSGNVKVNSIDAAVASALGLSATTQAGTGNVADITQVSDAEIISLVDAASSSSISIYRGEDGFLYAMNLNSAPGQSIEVHSNTTATALGFTVGSESSNSDGVAGVIPAGFRVRNSGGDEWVTMQDVAVAADNPGPYTVKVRPADDDGSASSAAAMSVNVVPYQLDFGAFAVINPQVLSAALTEAAIDAKYVAAIDKTKSKNNVSAEGNIIVSARQSNAVREQLRRNALDASSNLLGRGACIRPPLKTLRSVARSNTVQPGVGTYRNQRVWYCYPGVSIRVPQIAARGLEGGDGFTADGVIDVGWDTWVASICSQLNPEENPGQMTEFTAAVLGLERGNSDVQDMEIGDYTAFKAAGIAAPILDDGVAVVQSGVTSVNPGTHPNLVNIARRRMADFVQDSLARRAKSYSKKLNTRENRSAYLGEVDAFLDDLKNGTPQRIADYSIDAVTANTPRMLGRGIYRLIIKVRTLSSLDAIVLQVTAGEQVEVTELEAA